MRRYPSATNDFEVDFVVIACVILGATFLIGSCVAEIEAGVGIVIEKHYMLPTYKREEKFVLVVRVGDTSHIEMIEVDKGTYLVVSLDDVVDFWIKRGKGGYVYEQGITMDTEGW